LGNGDFLGEIVLTKFVFGVIQVVISQMNGKDHSSHSTHSFNVGRMRIKLCRGWITKAREIYSPTMQVLYISSLYFFFYGLSSLFDYYITFYVT
jgi:hypothetical protein